jgi:DNA-binding MarR family transcriptional regulator
MPPPDASSEPNAKNRAQTIRRLALQMFEMTKRAWLATQREKLKGGYDLSESEFLALDALERVRSLSVGELRLRVGVLPAQMSRVIKALEQRYDEKLVLCAINPRDKRKIDVSITPTGRRAVEAYRRAKIAATVKALHSLCNEDLEAFTAILDKIAGAAGADARPKDG